MQLQNISFIDIILSEIKFDKSTSIILTKSLNICSHEVILSKKTILILSFSEIVILLLLLPKSFSFI